MGFEGYSLKELMEMLAKEAANRGYAIQVKYVPLADISSLDSRQKIEIFGEDTTDDMK